MSQNDDQAVEITRGGKYLGGNQRVALAHRSKSGNWAEYAFPDIGSPYKPIVERDDGLFQIGLDDDAAGPFESRKFAEAVAARFVVAA